MSDEEGSGGGSLGGKFGAMMGRGAAKAGKKAAQSETGRRAGKAAMKGAFEGVKEDFTNRHEKPADSPTSTTPPKPETPKPATPATPASPATTVPSWEDNTQHHQHYQQPRTRQPPKPKSSLLERLKIKKSSNRPPPRRVVRREVEASKRIYVHRLAKQPDWDRHQMARTLFNFKAELNCDLEFRKGQVVQILTRTDTQEDWWEGQIEDRVGIFPANYVQLM